MGREGEATEGGGDVGAEAKAEDLAALGWGNSGAGDVEYYGCVVGGCKGGEEG